MLSWLRRLFRPRADPEPGAPEGGALFTRPATWEDVVQAARLLNRAGVRYLLVGGYALAAHGYVRMTEDIDIAVAPDRESSRRWVLALSRLPDGAARELAGEADPFEGDHLRAIRINDEFTVDVLPSVCGISFAELERHREWMTLDGERIPVLDLHGLLKTKQGVANGSSGCGRPAPGDRAAGGRPGGQGLALRPGMRLASVPAVRQPGASACWCQGGGCRVTARCKFLFLLRASCLARLTRPTGLGALDARG